MVSVGMQLYYIILYYIILYYIILYYYFTLFYYVLYFLFVYIHVALTSILYGSYGMSFLICYPFTKWVNIHPIMLTISVLSTQDIQHVGVLWFLRLTEGRG